MTGFCRSNASLWGGFRTEFVQTDHIMWVITQRLVDGVKGWLQHPLTWPGIIFIEVPAGVRFNARSISLAAILSTKWNVWIQILIDKKNMRKFFVSRNCSVLKVPKKHAVWLSVANTGVKFGAQRIFRPTEKPSKHSLQLLLASLFAQRVLW